MIVAHELENLQQAILEISQTGKTIALVPTMGALHAGHASLIREAKKSADVAIVSVFVNPKQFGVNEDFSRYPRTLEADKLIARDSGADIMYAPSVEDMYPSGFTSSISAGEIENLLCGKFRPGHFNGVATVVTKLLLRIMPHVAVFGMKDYQQLCIIERIVQDLDIPVEIIPAATVREKDGLALSSRNHYLSEEERKIAPILYQTLNNVAKELKHSPALPILEKYKNALAEAGFKVDYLELCDGETLVPLSKLEDDARILVAAWLGKTRLIDNIAAE